MELDKDQTLYIRAFGKAVRVTAIFTSVDEANAYMAANEGQALVAYWPPYCLIAHEEDLGVQIIDPKRPA